VAEALQRSDVKLMVGCRAGICGLCRVPHLSGDVIHRDFKLTDEERRTLMTSCVSGCSSGELVLDP
jgi:vanillate O-demethylase ferredoxin subunit